MENQSMRCKDCVLKHLAAAISYGKEIIAGHGYDGTPDHRPDYLGELVNAEHHLALLSVEFLNRVMVIRTAAQSKGITPNEDDIDALRGIWVDVEKTTFPERPVPQTVRNNTDKKSLYSYDDMMIEEQIRKKSDAAYDVQVMEAASLRQDAIVYPECPGLKDQGTIGILMDRQWDNMPERRDLFMRMAERYFKNFDKFYRPDDLKDYDKEWIWVFQANVFVAKECDALQPTPARRSENMPIGRVPRLVRAEVIRKVLEANSELSVMSALGSLPILDCPMGNVKEEDVCLLVYKQPCCSIKERLKKAKFVRVDDNGWPFMQKIWTDELA